MIEQSRNLTIAALIFYGVFTVFPLAWSYMGWDLSLFLTHFYPYILTHFAILQTFSSRTLFTRHRWNKIGELPLIDKKPDRDTIEIRVLPIGQVIEKNR